MRSAASHRGSGSSAKILATPTHRGHLSTNFEQTLRQYDTGRASDCWYPLGKGEGASPPLTHTHPFE